MSIVIELINGYRLLNKLKKIEKVPKRREIVRKASRESARPLFSSTKSKAPKRTGLLKRSIKLRASRKSRVRVGVNIIIRKLDWEKAVEKGLTRGKLAPARNWEKLKSGWYKRNNAYYQTQPDMPEFKTPKKWKLFYASFIEFGTAKIRATHFMRDEARKHKKSVMSDFMKRCFALIKEAAR